MMIWLTMADIQCEMAEKMPKGIENIDDDIFLKSE
jgi:hypothetical protein